VALLTAEHLTRTYRTGGAEIAAVADVALSVDAGEFVALVGPSGCGKSTLLHLCGAMDRPTSGTVGLEGVPLERLSDDELTAVRRDRIGFVFQFFNLLPTLTVLENVALPRLLAGARAGAVEPQARALLERVGLGRRLRHYPRQLSGGEMQRAAVARALIHRPALLIADEPTGNLDSENGRIVLELLTGLNRETGVTLLLATHDRDVAAAAGRTLRMRDGRFEADGAL
jgi:putative ABC transport system ATP-binding protein